MAAVLSPTKVAGDSYQIYEIWYNKLVNKNDCIGADVAAPFLKKSGLNDNLLSRIWDISDPGGKGFLNKNGFFIALKMVALVQNGKEPNIVNIAVSTPPPNMGDMQQAQQVSKSPGPPVVPAAPSAANKDVWFITPADRSRYDDIFNSLGPEANKIHGNKVRGVMMNSKLPTDKLGKIWDLSDMDKDGFLDRAEFSIAMHLIYKVLENHPLPNVLPPEMLSSARRGTIDGPTPIPLAPPSLAQENEVNKVQVPPAPWVVSAADKARYDVMFHNADIDKDGFVSGVEIKGIFLQSGLPQMVLAHIWNICDMKQIGKLTSEQFALAMWLVQQKISGVDPPKTLTPEMIPPTMRPKPTNEPPAMKPTYNNAELQVVADEIDELSKDKLKLEEEMRQKESSHRLKSTDFKNLQSELDTLLATLKQLENQKGIAQKKLDELGNQVETLREQVDEQETSLKAQEEEVMSKQTELNELRDEEVTLETSVESVKGKLERLSNSHQENQLYLSQVKTRSDELRDLEHRMTELVTHFGSAIAAEDASSLSEEALMEIHPSFLDNKYMEVGPTSPAQESVHSQVVSPVNDAPVYQVNGESEPESASKAKDTSFSGGHDPFAQAFGGNRNTQSDPFESWNSNKVEAAPVSSFESDPFGGDAFVKETQAPKAKKPPPRPVPPKARPAKPPPPQIKPAPPEEPKNAGFADFANFGSFDSQYSSAEAKSGSQWSPWGAPATSRTAANDKGVADVWKPTSSLGSAATPDPFGGDYDPFRSSAAGGQHDDFSWDDDPPSADSWIGASNAEDPFCLSLSPQNNRKTGSSDAGLFGERSKSVLGERSGGFGAQKPRSKTALGDPGLLDVDFDPLSRLSDLGLPSHKSNEDLLNQPLSSHHANAFADNGNVNGQSSNFSSGFHLNNNSFPVTNKNKVNSGMATGDLFSAFNDNFKSTLPNS